MIENVVSWVDPRKLDLQNHALWVMYGSYHGLLICAPHSYLLLSSHLLMTVQLFSHQGLSSVL